MEINSFNVRGIGKMEKRKSVMNILKKSNISLLQETYKYNFDNILTTTDLAENFITIRELHIRQAWLLC